VNNHRNNYRILAEEFYYNGKLESAIEFYNKALTYRGSVDDTCLILFNLGVIFWEMGNIRKAIYYNKKVLENDKNYKDAYYQLGLLFEDVGDINKSIKSYRRALRIDPEDKLSLYNLAVLYDTMGRDYLAESIYLNLIRLDPSNSYAMNNLGSLYESRGEYKKALKYVNRSIDIKDDFYLSHFNLGVILKALKRDEEAIFEYNKSLSLKEDYQYTYLNLSAIYIEKKDYLKSIHVLTKGIAECKVNHDLYYNRACSYAILNNREEALNDIRKCLELSPKLLKWVESDRDLDCLREDKEFINILINVKNNVRKDIENDNY